MAKQPQQIDAAPAAASAADVSSGGKYEPERIYEVKLRRAVKIGAATIRPLGVHQMTGAALIDIVAREGDDAVASAQPR